jgi:molybdenum-dependent DNA-binding transcriptional regulator ModE
LKDEIAVLLESGNMGTRGLILDDKGVIQLLQAAIEREGSISAFARRHGLERSQLTNMLNGKRPVSSPLVKALGLRKVYTTNV